MGGLLWDASSWRRPIGGLREEAGGQPGEASYGRPLVGGLFVAGGRHYASDGVLVVCLFKLENHGARHTVESKPRQTDSTPQRSSGPCWCASPKPGPWGNAPNTPSQAKLDQAQLWLSKGKFAMPRRSWVKPPNHTMSGSNEAM